MKSKRILLMMSFAMALSSLLASIGLFVGSFAQENMTSAANETGAMMGNRTNQTEGGNETQKGPLEQLGEALGGVFGGGGNQSQ
jgi:hypothetical protein